jgi:alkanesulfonate monooxygenase
MQIRWFIANNRDERYLGIAIGGRAITPDDLQQIAQAVDHLSYTSALLPKGRFCENAWMTAARLISVIKRTKFLVITHPGITFLEVAASIAATFPSQIYANEKSLNKLQVAPTSVF